MQDSAAMQYNSRENDAKLGTRTCIPVKKRMHEKAANWSQYNKEG